MEKDRFLLFIVLSAAIFLGWNGLIAPKLFPRPAVKNAPAVAAKPGTPAPNEKPKENGDKAAVAAAPQADAKPTPDLKPDPAAIAADKKLEAALKAPAHPHQLVKLGSLDFKSSPYRMQVTVDTKGATLAQIEFNDRQYRDSEPPYGPLKLLQTTVTPLHSLETGIPVIDQQFAKISPALNCRNVEWEVVQGSQSESGVTLRLKSPDGQWEALKKFTLQKISEKEPKDQAPAYGLQFEIQIRNLSAKPEKAGYELVGPVGLPLENPQYTREFRAISVGFNQGENKTLAKSMMAREVLTSIKNQKPEVWQEPVRYIGVNIQYFAALLLPQEDQTVKPYLKSVTPIIASEDFKKPEKSDVSVLLTSRELELAPAGKDDSVATHKYLLFAGPKREEFLRPIEAQHIILYGMAGNLGITQLMQGLLNTFHSLLPSWAWPWGWSIIMLTVVVRMAMFPFSRKQALSAARMQELQPEIAALKKKYAKEPEKLGRAQMELFRKNNYNPFGGCLIVFIQLPIFIGLYQALNISFDLRMAEFLWIKNLAAPDAIFRFPFQWPMEFLDNWIGPTFNLLPIFTIVLFMVQQKMMMPPPTDKEQEMQQNMMKYMMIFMGLMFYGVPAGLCVYFISSSLWGLAERKLLPKSSKSASSAPANLAVAAKK